MKTHRTVGALCAVLFAVLEVSAAHGRPRSGSSHTSSSEGTSPYSQRDLLYHRKTRNDLSGTVSAASSGPSKPRVDRQTQTVYSTLPDSVAAGGHYAPVVGPSATGPYGPPAPVHHEYPEPIIEIIIKESNESLPAPPPPPPPPRKKAREPVHVFYVKYKQNPVEYGKEGSGGVVFDEPIPALTPAPPPEEEEEEEQETPPETVTYAPAPRQTTTLRAIIHPDSEIAHASEGRLRVTFGGPHDDEQRPSNTYGQGLKRADDKETQESVQSAPQPSIAFPGPSALTKRHQQPGPAHFQQTAEHPVGQGRSHNPPPQPVNQYQRQYTTIPEEAYRGPFAPSTSFKPTPQLQPLENPRYPNLGPFSSGPQGGDRPIISDKPPPHQRQAPFPGSFPQNPNTFPQTPNSFPQNSNSFPQNPNSFPQNNFFPNRPPLPQLQHFPGPISQQSARIPQHQLLRERHHQQVIQQQLLRQQQEQQQKLQQQAQQQFIDQQQQHQHVLEQQKQQQFALEQQKRQQHLIDQQRQQYLQQQQQQLHIQQSPQQNPFNIPTSSRFQPRPPISPISIPASAEIVKSIPSAELHKVEQVPQFQIQQNTAPFQPSQPINVEALPVKPETPEQQFQLLKQRQYQQQQEALLRQQQILQQQQYQRDQEQRVIQQQQEQQAFLRQRQEQEQLEHKQRQQFLQQHNNRAPDEEVPPYRVRFSATPLPQPSLSIAPSSTTTSAPSSTTEAPPATEAPKTEEPKVDLSKKLAELPDEVPDDIRQHLLSSGILKDAQIQILDYDKIGDVPIEDLPPHALENFYGAGGASAASASETSSTISKPGSSKPASRSSDDQDSDNESEGSEIHERYVAPDAESSPSQVEMKVVRYDPTTAAGQSVAEKYLQKDATQVDPVVLNDNRYNRYLPLKVSGTQFPLPEEPLLRGRQVTSVVVLAPVDYDYLKPLPAEAEEKSATDRTGRAVEAHGVRFLAGEALRNLVREPSTDNFRAWLQQERATPLEHQSVILLVTNSDGGAAEEKPDRQIFMYDPVSERVSRLTGELSSSFVEVAESNAKSEDLDTLAEQGGGEDSVNTAASEPVEVRLKPERRTTRVSDMDASESQWTPIVGYGRRS